MAGRASVRLRLKAASSKVSASATTGRRMGVRHRKERGPGEVVAAVAARVGVVGGSTREGVGGEEGGGGLGDVADRVCRLR